MPTRFDQVVALIQLLWNRFMLAWYESEMRRLDTAIAKQKRILARFSRL